MPEPCVGCPEPKPPVVQTAVRWRIWYTGGRVFDGDDAPAWSALPDDGVLAVKVFFNDGLSRNCSGNDWYGLLLGLNGFTVIHNNQPEDENARRYPSCVWKRGMWTHESDMHRVNAALMEAV